MEIEAPLQLHSQCSGVCWQLPITQATAPAGDADTEHLLWTCPSLEAARTRHFSGTGLHPGRLPDLHRSIWGSHHRSLLAFLRKRELTYTCTVVFMPPDILSQKKSPCEKVVCECPLLHLFL